MPTLIKNGKNYSGTSVSLTQAEYDALTETQKNDGTVYFITDSDAVLDASDVSVGSGTMEDVVGSIAVIETSPATSAHAVGTYLVYNGKLYKVTSAIAVGETLTVGTNISATNVGDVLCPVNRTSAITYASGYSSTSDAPVVLSRFGNLISIRGNALSSTGTLSANTWATICTLPSDCLPYGGTMTFDCGIYGSGNSYKTTLRGEITQGGEVHVFTPTALSNIVRLSIMAVYIAS